MKTESILNVWVLKTQKNKKKRLPIMYWPPKMQKNPAGELFIIISYALQNKFLNLFSMSWSSYTPFISFSTLYTKLLHDKTKYNFPSLLIVLLKEGTKLLWDYLMVQHTGGRKQKGDLVLVKDPLKQLWIFGIWI